MIENKYDAVICDLGNVLINFDHTIAVKRILHHTPKKEGDIYNLFFDSPITKLYEEGKITEDEFFRRVKDSLELDIDYGSFLPIWNEIFFEAPLNIKMQDLIRIIKSSYKLVLVSNINKAHFEFLNKKFGIFSEFDKLILSYEAGFRKPAPEIYKLAMESVKVAPSRMFYVDDRRDLIEAGSKLGIKGMVFDGEHAFGKIAKELKR